MHWNGLAPVMLGLLVGGYGLWAASSDEERARNRRSGPLMANLASRLPKSIMGACYALFGGFFVIDGLVFVFTGHPVFSGW